MKAVFGNGFLRFGEWIMDQHLNPIFPQFFDNVGNLAVAQVRHILFKRQSQDDHFQFD